LGRRRFSSLDLIGSASALDLIDGNRKQFVLAAWMVIPVLTAAGYVLAAVGRHRLLALPYLLMGPTYLAALQAVRSRPPLRPLWSLHLGVTAAVATTLIGVGLLLTHARPSTPAARAPAPPVTDPADG